MTSETPVVKKDGMAKKRKVLIAAGGSGGHIFPAIALGRKLKEIDARTDIMFVGSNKALDKRLFEKEGVTHALLSTNKLPYKPSLGLIAFFARLSCDIARSFAIMVRYKPDAVAGFGGYVSFPVILAAFILRVPSIVHEQNAVPGRANKVLFKLADKIAISFDRTRAFLPDAARKVLLTGNPIRTEIFKDDRAGGIRKFGLMADKFTILVIGGSQGAHALNKTFIESISSMDAEVRLALQVIHITGVKDYEWALKEYEPTGIGHRVHSFIDRIEEAYAASDLVVTRSGSSALFELAFLGKPMVLVPYPFAMSHQIENAIAFSKNGAAVIVYEKELTTENFKDTLVSLVNDKKKLVDLGASARRLSAPDAAGALARAIFGLMEGRQGQC